MALKFIAGQEVWDAMTAEKDQKVSKTDRGYNSRELIALQGEWANRGILGATIMETFHKGWSLRFDSGIQNFGIIDICPTREAIEYRAKAWVAVNPANRYVFEKV